MNKFTLIAAALLASSSVMAADGVPTMDQRKPIPITLLCPAKISNGTLEQISRNMLGGSGRMRVIFESNKITSVNVFAAEKDSSFHVLKNIDLAKETNPIEKWYGEGVARRGDQLKHDVCDADAETKARYYATLAANRAKFGLK